MWVLLEKPLKSMGIVQTETSCLFKLFHQPGSFKGLTRICFTYCQKICPSYNCCVSGSFCSMKKTPREPPPALFLASVPRWGTEWWGTDRPCWSPAPQGLCRNAENGYSAAKSKYLHNAYLPLIAKNKFYECFCVPFPRFLAGVLYEVTVGLSAQFCASGFIH